MSTTTNSDTQVTLEQKINAALKNTDANGKLKFSDTDSEEFKVAVRAEKQARDTRSQFTKQQQQIAELKAGQGLTPVDAPISYPQSIEDLKDSDPDEWFKQRMAFTESTRNERQKALVDAQTAATNEVKLERRKILASGFEQRTGLTLDKLQEELPGRILKMIDTHDFADFLDEAEKFLEKGKKVASPRTDQTTDLGDADKTVGKITAADRGFGLVF